MLYSIFFSIGNEQPFVPTWPPPEREAAPKEPGNPWSVYIILDRRQALDEALPRPIPVTREVRSSSTRRAVFVLPCRASRAGSISSGRTSRPCFNGLLIRE